MKREYHNPDNLTPEQVGEGYRLLLKSEIKQRPKCHKEIEGYLSSTKDWHESRCGYYGDNQYVTYRVPIATWPLPKDISDMTTESEKTSLGRIAYDAFNKASHNSSRTWELASDKAKKYWESAALAVKSECAKESAPTDNDAWNSLLVTNSQLGKKVAELERELSIMSKSRDIVSDYQDELEAKLKAAEEKIRELQGKDKDPFEVWWVSSCKQPHGTTEKDIARKAFEAGMKEVKQ